EVAGSGAWTRRWGRRMHIEQPLTGGHAVDAVTAVRIGERAHGRSRRPDRDYGRQMNALPVRESDTAGDATGRLRQIALGIQIRDARNVIRRQWRVKRSGAAGDFRGHQGSGEGVLKSDSMAHLMSHGEEKGFGEAGPGPVAEVSV